MHNAPRAELRDEEREERSEEDIADLEEVAGPDILGVVPEERGPGPTTWAPWPRLAHIPLNCPLRNLDIEFQQFALHALDTPQAVVGVTPSFREICTLRRLPRLSRA